MATLSNSRDAQLACFGSEFARCCESLNDNCAKFFQLINGEVFGCEREWREALSVFKQSILDHSVGRRPHKLAVYQEVETFLLNPPKTVLSWWDSCPESEAFANRTRNGGFWLVSINLQSLQAEVSRAHGKMLRKKLQSRIPCWLRN